MQWVDSRISLAIYLFICLLFWYLWFIWLYYHFLFSPLSWMVTLVKTYSPTFIHFFKHFSSFQETPFLKKMKSSHNSFKCTSLAIYGDRQEILFYCFIFFYYVLYYFQSSSLLPFSPLSNNCIHCNLDNIRHPTYSVTTTTTNYYQQPILILFSIISKS